MLLRRFVNRNDRTKIIQYSNIYNQNANKEVNYLFKVCFTSRTDTETNANVAKSIYDFLTYIFKGEEDHIHELLKSDQTRVLAIFHKKRFE